jgi:hypothetical protein
MHRLSTLPSGMRMNAAELGRLTVLDLDGRAVPLGDLWKDQPAVLVWLRHYG